MRAEPVPFGWELPYASRRQPVIASNVVATSQPLAVEAGLEMLRAGGTAADAAIAAAITLVVVEPTNNGLGSDAFAIVHAGDQPIGLNGSGRSPRALDARMFAATGSAPFLGWPTVTVPGAVSAWVALSQRFGRLAFDRLFEPAIRYAAEGFPVSPIVARQWALVAGMYQGMEDFRAAFLPKDRAPQPGDVFRLEGLAQTLAQIADTGGEAFYRGDLARRIAEHARATGGWLDERDLEEHESHWCTPLSVKFRDYRLHELPPNTQGVAALIGAGILDMLADADGEHCAESLDREIEAVRLGLELARRHVGDPDHPSAQTVGDLLDRTNLEKLAAQVALGRTQAGSPCGPAMRGDTVYIAAADADGMMVSFIQSNYWAFGSGIVIPGTGISLGNRGACFSLEKGHPNEVGPGRRPFHTIIPAFLTLGNGTPVMAFGVMGGPMQPQGHVQILRRIIDRRENPQAAIDAPRWQILADGKLAVEPEFPNDLADQLEARGHKIQRIPADLFGGAQAIWRLAGGYLGASDPRKDGIAAGF